ncbi:MAG: heavy-metal-associated domain-containing protein [Burkholderiaceae bacterium]|nr:heavy-metal-associated domain-containing protein [Burkholderiaceae bacterium]
MTIELTLPTMTCGHCVKTVTAALQRLDAQARIAADLATRQLRVDTSAARETVLKALADEGYPAT